MRHHATPVAGDRPAALSDTTTAHVSAHALTHRFAARATVLGGGSARVHAVEEVSFHIARAGALGLVGESGCGKTTLARALLRLVEPTAGSAVIDGVDLATLDDAALRRFRRRAQVVFQDSLGALDPRHTAARAIAEPLRLHRIVERAAESGEVARLLGRVGLDAALATRHPHQLSGGQRQRVAIARALASRPAFLVADEPMGALDAEHRARLAGLLAGLRAEEGLTLLLISHDLDAVRRLCDRVAVMYLGRIVEEAASAALFARPRHPYTRALLAAAPAWPPVAERSGLRLRLAGEPPSPVSPPRGCAFHPRCPTWLSRDRPRICAEERPLLNCSDGGHGGHDAQRVACHFPG